jgi:2,5-diamino-6-(ribosylamino)-4(3H)-pyrimidinone 5'-phosphate reductase
MNMAMSADGKISTHRRESFPLGSKEDRHLMDVIRARTDAVIIGATTLRLDGWAVRVRERELRDRRAARGKHPHPLNVVLSSKLDLPMNSQFFTHPDTDKLIITTRQASEARLRRARGKATVVVLPRKTTRPQDVVRELERLGVRRILIEGGGEVNFSFFKEGLVDEVYLTVTPRIIGGRSAPTPVDGPGFLKSGQKELQLVSCRRRGDEVFLKYRVR